MSPSGMVTAVGLTQSANFPTTKGALHETTNGGGGDGYLVQFRTGPGPGSMVELAAGSGRDRALKRRVPPSTALAP